MNRRFLVLFAVAGFALTSGMASAAMVHTDGWDVSGDLAEWMANTTKTNVVVEDTGGNPDGYLFTESTGHFLGYYY